MIRIYTKPSPGRRGTNPKGVALLAKPTTKLIYLVRLKKYGSADRIGSFSLKKWNESELKNLV